MNSPQASRQGPLGTSWRMKSPDGEVTPQKGIGEEVPRDDDDIVVDLVERERESSVVMEKVVVGDNVDVDVVDKIDDDIVCIDEMFNVKIKVKEELPGDNYAIGGPDPDWVGVPPSLPVEPEVVVETQASRVEALNDLLGVYTLASKEQPKTVLFKVLQTK